MAPTKANKTLIIYPVAWTRWGDRGIMWVWETRV